MFVSIAEFPAIKDGKETEFLEWFAWSNEEFAKFNGFIRRRLLKPQGDGNFVALIEFASYENFKAVGDSPFHAVSARRVLPLLEGNPAPAMYHSIIG
jgi:heme-degrading monooxygenase HmoA